MTKEQMKRSKQAVYKVSYHFVCIPKRRKKVFVGDVAMRLQVVKAFKGRPSHILRKALPHLLQLASLWTHSYFVRTAVHLSAQTIERYIREQSK